MTPEHLRDVLSSYKKILEAKGYEPVEKPRDFMFPTDNRVVLNHCCWMCGRAIGMIDGRHDEGKDEVDELFKANRFLAFVQGCLWFCRVFSIEDAREHSRPARRGGVLPAAAPLLPRA